MPGASYACRTEGGKHMISAGETWPSDGWRPRGCWRCRRSGWRHRSCRHWRRRMPRPTSPRHRTSPPRSPHPKSSLGRRRGNRGADPNHAEAIDRRNYNYMVDFDVRSRRSNPDIDPSNSLEFVNHSESWGTIITKSTVAAVSPPQWTASSGDWHGAGPDEPQARPSGISVRPPEHHHRDRGIRR